MGCRTHDGRWRFNFWSVPYARGSWMRIEIFERLIRMEVDVGRGGGGRGGGRGRRTSGRRFGPSAMIDSGQDGQATKRSSLTGRKQRLMAHRRISVVFHALKKRNFR